MADTYEAFYNGKPLNPNRGLPTMTYAQAEDCGLTESERLWCRTDGEDTPITADDIPYDSSNSVKDMLTPQSVTISSNSSNVVVNRQSCYKIGKVFYYDIGFGVTGGTASGTILKDFPTPKDGIYDNAMFLIGQDTAHLFYITTTSIELRNQIASGTYVLSGSYIFQ